VGFYLIDKGQSDTAGAHDEGAVALANDHRTRHPSFSADVLCGRHRGLTLLATFGLCGRPALDVQGWKLIFSPCFPPVRQPTGRGVDELAVHAAGETPPAPAPGLFLRHRPDCRTMVVVPTMLTSLEGVDRLIET
jgi:hypothetical protein